MKLTYEAFDKLGHRQLDHVEAGSAAEAAAILRKRDLFVVRIGPAGAAGAADPSPAAVGRRVGPRRLKELAIFTRQLYVLVSCGTPLVQALGSLERQIGQGGWRDTVGGVRRRVEEGASLTEAMKAHPDSFDAIYCGLVQAGESSGCLAAMLQRLGKLTEKRLKVRNALLGAMIYPCLLLAVCVAVVTLMLVFVVPRFAELFGALGVPLPGTTQALIGVSGFMRAYWWLLVGLLAGTIVGVRFWAATRSGRMALDSLSLRLPKVGRIVAAFAIARIARVLGVLLEGRVPVLEALRLTGQAAGNHRFVQLMARAEESVARGEPISAAFSHSALISPSVCQAINSGEQSGQLAPLLLNIADFQDDENDTLLRSLTSIVEPAILLLLGVLVGLVALSLFLPLFDLTSMASGGQSR